MNRDWLTGMVVLLGTGLAGQAGPEPAPVLRLRSEAATLTVALEGGALVAFQPSGHPINPLSWVLEPDERPAGLRGGVPFRGHFLCLGRWGRPSPGEMAAGVPHNGEPAAGTWERLDGAVSDRESAMQFLAPIEQWTVRRRVRISASSALVRVDETFTNNLPTGRFSAIVQHATLGPPFLARTTLIDCNGGPGFNQALVRDGVIGQPYRWPNGVADGQGRPLDLRRCDAPEGYVSTHVVEQDWGWVTAASVDVGWMIGYIWPARDYPWLHLWHGVRDGQVRARGLEFATTGLGDTVSPEIRAVTRFAGRDNLLFVDARGSVARGFRVFLLPIPGDFLATQAVVVEGDDVIVDVLTASGAVRRRLAWTD